MNINIESTADGSPTLYRPDIDEHYHSVKGALAESRHVYLNLGWRKRAGKERKIRVFEIGFGTGLNAAITAHEANLAGCDTDYFSAELFPLSPADIDKLIPFQDAQYIADFKAVNYAVWDEEEKINPYFKLHKLNDNLLAMSLPEEIDVVYFDAFSPEKQPELWSEEVFSKIFAAMAPGGVLTTYCAKGSIRRLLQQTGFITERLSGPPSGKREVLRATKPPTSALPPNP